MKANTNSSKKQKGSRLENKIAGMYRHYNIDPKAHRMPMSGGMRHFKGDVLKPNDYGWIDECKNTEKPRLWEFWDQANNQSGSQIPLLHISGNFRPILTVMAAETYFELRKTIKDLEEIINQKRS